LSHFQPNNGLFFCQSATLDRGMEKQSHYSFIEWCPFFLGIGIGLFFTGQGPPPFTILVGAGFFLVFMLLALKNQRLRSFFLWKALIAILSGFLLPVFPMTLNTTPSRFFQIKRPIFQTTVEGRVKEISFSTEKPTVVLGGCDLMIRFQTPKRPWKFRLKKGVIRLIWRAKDPLPTLGQILEIPAVLMPIPSKVTPYGFDPRRWAYFFHVIGKGYATGPPIIRGQETPSIIQVTRGAINREIKRHLSGHQAGLAAALITGDRSALSPKIRQQFVDAGIAHVLAISGLHLTLVAGLFFFALRRLLCCVPGIGLFYDTKKIAAPFALVAAFFYLLLSGLSISTQRAFIMLAVAFVAILIDRPPLSKRSLMVAAILVLVCQPLALFMASFHLSFFAVLALIEGYTFWKGRFIKKARGSWIGKGIHYLKGVLLSSLIASLATIPFTLYHFQKMTLQSLGSNLLVIPLMAFWIMPAALLSMLTMPFGIEGPFLHIMGVGISLMEQVAATVSKWPGASILFPEMPPISLALMMVGSFFLFMMKRWGRFLGVLLLFSSLQSGMIIEKPVAFIGFEAQVVGLVQQDTFFVTQKKTSFFPRVWGGSLGYHPDQLKNLPESGVITLPCGEVAYGKTKEAVAALCQKGRILVSKFFTSCPDARSIITRRAVERHGFHFIYCNGHSPVIQTAMPKNTNWPWERR
jgi:competence protein ComEC